MNALRFENKVVIVTGGASGIGFATAMLFAEEGALVAVNDMRTEAADAAVQEIRARCGRAIAVPGDVSDPDFARASVRKLVTDHGRVDVLVNNAAMITLGSAESIPVETWTRTVAVNLNAPFFWAQAVAAESMLARGEGVIVNVASIAGQVGGPSMAAYVATKHGVVGLTKALAVDWGSLGTRVNALCPGLTETEMVKAVRTREPAMFVERQNRIPLGHPATPLDQAHAILFMASAEASSVHGLIMNVDGGTVAMSSGYSIRRTGTA